ncbi:MAG TPA: glycosyltransferase family 4 protein [Blastocatellia bacterium]|nr:glycosyltransferase family 4 protein [Blastocatellia bacterium]HMY70949.1 glycosyltransferase family 4 protein [Blastocatellia bacterium]HMZ16405.1 glycosyltransferase family 4 protein [Blastocatellia bacterium]HNG31527.1 glycosyltransferase family 4 protein [Blastocatellia bacterium]
MNVTAVELSGVDETYAWDDVSGADGFDRVTVFENADSRTQPAGKVRERMRATLDGLQPDVVVVPGWSDSGALAALKWCISRQVPAVIMSETTAWDFTRRAVREWVKRGILRLCSSALVGGQAHSEYLVQLGMPAERVFLGYDAIDNEYFIHEAEAIRSDAVSIRRRHDLPEHYFLASARFIEQKNLHRLFGAYARYRQLCREAFKKPWDLVLLGDGELQGALSALRTALGLNEFIHMPGFKQYPELPVFYGLAGAFVHVSVTEPWGLVVNEAMASGLPVLVSDRCGCARDLVRNGRNGFTFNPYDEEYLAGRLLLVSELETEQRAAMGIAGQEIIGQWGPERFADGLVEAVDAAMTAFSPAVPAQQRWLLNLLCQYRFAG